MKSGKAQTSLEFCKSSFGTGQIDVLKASKAKKLLSYKATH